MFHDAVLFFLVLTKNYGKYQVLWLAINKTSRVYTYVYIILIARVRVQYGKIFYEHAKYFHEPKASENVA